MTKRENLISLYRRKGYGEVPVEFYLCPSLLRVYEEKTGGEVSYEDYFEFSHRNVSNIRLPKVDKEIFKKYHGELKPGTYIDDWGCAHEPGSADAKHMTYLRNPLKNCDSLQMMQEYPYPDWAGGIWEHQKDEVASAHAKGCAAVGSMQMSIWETAWFVRGMEELMMDMMTEDPMAEFLLDTVTAAAITRAQTFAEAGCDMLFLGDDIGMQQSIMMSETLYCDWLKPRLKKLIDAARAINPEIIVLYHTCGYVEPLIPHLIDAGVDVLNPVQPECMDFKKIHDTYGDRLSFNGTIGTQTTMPFGTPDEVRRVTFENLSIAGDKGGLLCCPTHVLEPEVPWENVLAYVQACKDFK